MVTLAVLQSPTEIIESEPKPKIGCKQVPRLSTLSVDFQRNSRMSFLSTADGLLSRANSAKESCQCCKLKHCWHSMPAPNNFPVPCRPNKKQQIAVIMKVRQHWYSSYRGPT